MNHKYSLTVFGQLAIVGVALTSAVALAQSRGAPQLRSPELTEAGDVTLRLRAPEAASVRLTSGGDIPGLAPGTNDALTRTADGVWEITLAALEPGAFRYNFNVDGVATLDPGNPLTSQSNANAWSLFHVPGKPFMDTLRTPHGAVAEVVYYSELLGQHRRMHVYTPPGYQLDRRDYPVLYLLHGAGDSDDSWSTVGRAGVILDNLISSGDAEPMLIVMPHGHQPTANGPGGMQITEFADEFAAEIKPHIEANYRVRAGRAETAIAGLSMGGAHTLEIALDDLGEYGYIGVFSSGVFSVNQDDSYQTAHRAALENPALRNGLEHFWFAIGDEDFLLDTAQASVDMFREFGFDIVYHESGGGHTWMNWRDYLHEFAQQLFR
jgi:enterochelin esterase family protein